MARQSFFKNYKFLFFALILGIFGLHGSVLAVVKSPQPPLTKGGITAKLVYSALEVKRSAKTIELLPGDSTTFTITFKNTGPTTWSNTGNNFVSVYNVTSKKNKSKFFDSENWLNSDQPTVLKESAVKKGQVGTFTFTLYAPLEPGTYLEKFKLAAEDLTYIKNSDFTIKILVSTKVKVKTSAKDGSAVRLSSPSKSSGGKIALGYRANQLIMSDAGLQLTPNATQTIRVAFKNTGKAAWVKSGQKPLLLKAKSIDALFFKDQSWTANIAATLPIDIKPEEVHFFDLKVTAPARIGTYDLDFIMTVGDEVVPGGGVELPIEVVQGEVAGSISKLEQSEFANSGPRGPILRVGLFSTTAPVTVVASGTYTLVDGDSNSVKQLSGVTTMAYDFNTGAYTVQNGSYFYSSIKKVRLYPDNPATTIFQISSYNNIPTWDKTINFNQFRGNLELSYSKKTGKLWVIEEVPTEDYMLGLAETSNGSPYEFQKTLVTAARTYALFVKSIGGKYKSEFFDLGTTGNDQVYKGYVSELVRPNVAKAATETRGVVVTYNNELVVTPYFSRSDGRTRAWGEVWYGNRAWLVSKPAIYDVGKTLWGHGVGMSASDAVGKANAGETWDQILPYYYTGTRLMSLY